ncbi:double-strand break repair helicase AddA [Asticcacaulis sp. AC460]|uniref:double-strand break repair helicase AddA n=1 Tax=Asticcacaulis sp. AC460 TaxID=1282360 RepID=UPI0003C40758|nr:double-strand break repair helicase AddA [Asticcacaulis sp. AC460]ESQ90812.1 double-strand break repair helicase AddA [Asticcacaulis sp. AC460]
MNARPQNPQNIAADPKASCFLTANAGSGKTSTLVNRVARLLLSRADPEHILCVTYTKAAAAEMQDRLFQQLGGWAVADDDQLIADLERIGEATHDLPRARALFAKALETPGGLKIQTIHAFCEKLLRRFPLEARLSPAFKVLDDLVGEDLAEAATTAVLTLDAPGLEAVAEARDRLIRKLKVMGFEKLLGQFIHQHDALQERFEHLVHRSEDWQTGLFHSLGLDGVCTSQECLDAYADTLEWHLLEDLGQTLLNGTTATNQKAGQAFLDLYESKISGRPFDFEEIKGIFLTKDGSPRKNVYTKGTAPADARYLDRMAEEVIALADRLRAVDIAGNTLDALRLFQIFSAVYQREKAGEGALDFTDLINRTKDLLRDPVQAAWVLYKLDGGLDHILVDEAQDTSEEQWIIVDALSSDFFSGEGVTRTIRTLFAVGDEKQSIYGFQGADPREFLKARAQISQRAHDGGANLVEPELIDSWRSLPEILGFVDAVFADGDVQHALNFSSGAIHHIARRGDASGVVELWPMVRPMAAVETTADDDDEQAALDDPGRNPPSKRLAKQIAATIRSEIAAGRTIYDKALKRRRTVHAGDVLILVRKRDHLFEHIIRELKIAGVAVSGADRLKLGDHIAFQDLRALLRVCLQPMDALSLACVLRSPLCDLSESDLFELAHHREGNLWSALLKHPATEGPIDAARVFLLWAQETAWRLTAFDFLARVLNRRDFAGRSFRQRFLTRLGDECEDVLDETLALALKGEGAGAAGLSACLDLFEFQASQIKREQEEGGHAVRVMTVHGSKGLEAPWVIVPVGPQYGARKEDLILTGEDGQMYLCAGGKKADTAVTGDIRDQRALRDEQESLRLFYVALTRARDRLTVCAYTGTKPAATGNFPSWYDLASDAFDRLETTSHPMTLVNPFDDGEIHDEAQVRVFGEHSEALTAEARLHEPEVPLPDFALAMVTHDDIETERWAAISQMGDEDRTESETAPSPLQTIGSLGRYRRGNLIHKLFEILPDIAPDNRIAVAGRYLGRQADLTDAQREEMTGAVMAVLTDARFAEAFGPQSRPEIALAGQVGVNPRGEAIMLSGRIDRLVITDDRVVIIDYKSNRPAPDRAEDAAVAYQRQMAGYVALLRQVYPDRAVEAALLWTDGPRLTPMSETLVQLRLDEILSR